MSLNINVRQSGEVTILDLDGRITLGEATAMMREEIRQLVTQGNTKILLNLANVSYIDSSGLGDLVGSFATVTNKGGRLKLLNLQKKVHDLLQITKLLTVFEVFTNEAAALRSFQTASAAQL